MKDPYGPKRRQTNPIPRVSLPPTEGSVPDLAEKLGPDAITLEECPLCRCCSLCAGKGMVPQEIAGAYRASLTRDDEDEEVSG